jgi:uncharacterized surface anchored protein
VPASPISAVTAHQDLIMKDYALSMITLVAGALVGIISTYLSAKQKFRDDLQAKFNESLHESRVTSYQKLWEQLQVLAKYARPRPVTPERLRTLAEDLRTWYFEVGGLFLTDNSRNAYFALQDAIVTELAKKHPENRELVGAVFEEIRQKGSNLRTNLSTDLRSRRQPDI